MIAAAFKSLTGWKGYAVAALAGGLLLGGAAWKAQGWRGAATLAMVQADYAREREGHAQASMAAIEAARTEERRRTAAVEKVRETATKQTSIAVADAIRARDERDRLLVRADTLARAAADRDPAAAVGSTAGSDAVDLLAHMLRRVSLRAEELARIADRARIAGLTCERAYDSLR
ncbi:DUF2514 family protein [Achromobacter animicus]|uniref:DUF2514 family protein n=1 Tax=Achromobacter animicus TaxID=1389935 RepID=UPI0028AFA1F7|nr:DUF2514 family protein [Achromobacter animicus]